MATNWHYTLRSEIHDMVGQLNYIRSLTTYFSQSCETMLKEHKNENCANMFGTGG